MLAYERSSDDLAKVGVEGSSPFARSRFSSMANEQAISDRPPIGGLAVFGPICDPALVSFELRFMPHRYLRGHQGELPASPASARSIS
jgi:hypothetical protein